MTTERTPELESVLARAVEYYLQDLHTCMPARVTAYDEKKQMVEVQPTLKRMIVHSDGTSQTEQLPIIPNVPLVFPRAGGFFFSMPVEKGDQVMLHFSQGSLDNWLSGSGDVTDTEDVRLHDITDAIAVPGLYTFSKAIRDITSSGLRLGEDGGGVQITLTKSGTMEVSLNGTSNDAAMLGNIFKIWWNSSIVPWLATHVHPTALGPSGPPVTPLPPFDENIVSKILKIKGP
jgi:hypothetical protein